MKVAVISGASSGIGRALVAEMKQKGYQVYDLSRSGASGADAIHIKTDVTDENAVKEAFLKISAREGHIDRLILSAGYGISGAAEFTDSADALRQMQVNFHGVHLCIKYAMPLLRAGKGRIVGVSSAAAVFPIPFQSFYSASKAAVNSFLLALRNEVKCFGVDVTCVMPGDVATGFTDARKKEYAGEEVYGGRIAPSVAVMEKDEKGGMHPEYVARVIAKICEKRHTRPLYTIGISYKFLMVLGKLIGKTLVNTVLGILYIKKPK